MLLPGYIPHTYSCADIQSLSILISTNSTAWDHAAAFKSTTVAFFVLLKLPMPFLLHLSVMDETNHSLRELPRNMETVRYVIYLDQVAVL